MRLPPLLSFQFWPDVPEEVRGDYLREQYAHLARQVPLLYLTLILIVFAAMVGVNGNLHPLIRIGVPVTVVLLSIGRMLVWLQRPDTIACPQQARRMLLGTKVISGAVGAVCSLWCVNNWANATPGTEMYFPLFMVMGAFATISCLSMSRSAVFINILTTLMPITLALLLSGDGLSIAAGASIATTAAFLMGLLRRKHERTVELLLLQHRMRELAETDPLTGLLNRRALQDRMESAIRASTDHDGPVLILLDLDGFKPVNDRHGHGAGDEVLIEVAARLLGSIDDEACACRLGGDEFAVLLPPGSKPRADVLATQVLAAFARPFVVDGQALHVGASLGMARWDEDGETIAELFAAADKALYLAKSERDGKPAAAVQAVRKAWVIG